MISEHEANLDIKVSGLSVIMFITFTHTKGQCSREGMCVGEFLYLMCIFLILSISEVVVQ